MFTSVNSIANPVRSSSLSTRGVKPISNTHSVSVGITEVSPGVSVNYRSVNRSGVCPVEIDGTSGLATFAVPQDDSRVGIGDTVIVEGSGRVLSAIISGKKSLREWYLNWGSMAPAGTLYGRQFNAGGKYTVRSISRSFSTIPAAISAITTGLDGEKNTSGVAIDKYDLKSRQMSINIALYDGGQQPYPAGHFFETDADHNFNVICPVDISNHCNSSQLHKVEINNDFVPSSLNGSIRNVKLRGQVVLDMPLKIFNRFDISGCIANAITQSYTNEMPNVRVYNNVITGQVYHPTYNVYCNTFYNSSTAIRLYDSFIDIDNLRIYNNVFAGCVTPIHYNSSTDITPIVSGNILTNASAAHFGTSENQLNVPMYFLDAASNNFRMRVTKSITSPVIGGLWYTEKDMYGEIRGASNYPGASRHNRTSYSSVGLSSSVSATGTVTTVGCIATFTSPQTADWISAGCTLTSGPNTYSLVRKINDTSWEVSGLGGTAPLVDVTNASFQIKHQFNSLQSALDANYYQTRDVVINCVEGDIGTGVVEEVMYADWPYRITIQVPCKTSGPDAECNKSRRYTDMSQEIYVKCSSGIVVKKEAVLIEGLTFTGGDGVVVEDGHGVSVCDCVFIGCTTPIVYDKSGSQKKLQWCSNMFGATNAIANNLILDSSGNAISIFQNIGSRGSAMFNNIFSTGINLKIDPLQGFSDFNKFTMKIEIDPSAPYPEEVRWRCGHVDIKLKSISGFASAATNGTPWATITLSGTQNANSDGGVLAMSSADYIYGFDEGVANEYYAIYNNTIIGCDVGVYAESIPSSRFSNIAYIKNNVIQSARGECISSSNFNSDLIVCQSNVVSDVSIYKFNSDNCFSEQFSFCNIGDDSFKPSLYAHMRYRGENTSADELYQSMSNPDGTSVASWTPGYFNYSYGMSGKIVVASYGVNQSNFTSGGDFVSIKDGILTFSGVMSGHSNLCHGDKVLYGTSGECYLIEKATDLIWKVSDKHGDAPADTLSVSVTSVSRAASSLDAFQGTVESMIETRNIVNAGLRHVIMAMCNDGDIDTVSLVVDGWTTSLVNNIIITSAWDTRTQSVSRHAHSPYADGATIKSLSDYFVIEVNDEFVTLKGLTISSGSTGTSSGGVKFGVNSNNSSIQSCVIRGGYVGVDSSSSSTHKRFVKSCMLTRQINTSVIASDNTIVMGCTSVTTTGKSYVGNSTSTKFINCVGESPDEVFSSCYPLMCASSDHSADVSPDVSLTYQDKASGNVRIIRSDWPAIGIGQNYNPGDILVSGGYVDTGFYFSDVDLNMIFPDDYSAGCNFLNDVSTVNLYFSVGKDTSDLVVGNGLGSISNGVLTLGVGDVSNGVCIGDVVTATMQDGTVNEYILGEKVSDYIWSITNRFGVVVSDEGSCSVQIHHAFSDIKTAVQVIKSRLSFGTHYFTDLSSARYKINIPVVMPEIGETYEGGIDVSGYVADAENYINIFVATDVEKHCNENSGHFGVSIDPLGAGARRCVVVYHTSTSYDAVSIGVAHTRFSGFIVKGNNTVYSGSSSRSGIRVSANGCTISNNIMYNFPNGVFVDDNCSASIVCNVLYKIRYIAFRTNLRSFVSNNTAHEFTSKGFSLSVNDICVNNVAVAGSGGGAATCFYGGRNLSTCVSSDSSAGFYNGCWFNSTTQFRSAQLSNLDQRSYRPAVTDHYLKGTGLNVSGNQYLKYNEDATGHIRFSSFWDIGALSYMAKNPVLSVSNIVVDISSASIGYQIHNVDGYSIVTFDTPMEEEHVFAGYGAIDSMRSATIPVFFLCKKISNRQWIVTDPAGYPITANMTGSVDVFSPRHKSTSLDDGVVNNFVKYVLPQYTLSLYGMDKSVDIAIGADVARYMPQQISGWLTRRGNGINIYTPNDTRWTCNTSQRHEGVMPKNSRTSYLYYDAFKIDKVDNVSISGLSIKTYCGYGAKIINSTGKNTVVQSCILDSGEMYGSTRSQCDAAISLKNDNYINNVPTPPEKKNNFLVFNNIVTNIFGDAIVMEDNMPESAFNNPDNPDNDATSSYSSYTTSNCIDNNTVVNCGRGVCINKVSDRYYIHNVFFYIRNNIVKNARSACYTFDSANDAGKINMISNVSTDRTSDEAIGGMSNISMYQIGFSDEPNGIYYPDVRKGNMAIGSGLDISSGYINPFQLDMIDVDRDEDGWTIGALEYTNIYGYGKILFSHFKLGSKSVGIVDNSVRYTDLYLIRDKDELIGSVSPAVQFESIDDLNHFVATSTTIDNIRVHVQTGKRFTGVFKFKNLGVRSVYIKTIDSELEYGPSYIGYGDVNSPYLIEKSSAAQETIKKITIEGLKVYPDYTVSTTSSSMLPATVDVGEVEFINSIVFSSVNSVVTNGESVTMENSIVVYRNNNSATSTYLSTGVPSKSVFVNSIAITWFNQGVSFEPSDSSLANKCINSLAYNYSEQPFTMPLSSVSCIEYSPLFREAKLIEQLFRMDIVTAYNFSLDKNSVCVNSGDNSYVSNIPHDIAGNDRIYLDGVVDMGPYESIVNNFSVSSDDIRTIYQSKLNINHAERLYTQSSAPEIFRDLYSNFANGADAEEFVRQSNIVIGLKRIPTDKIEKSDKIDMLMGEFKASFDYGTLSIVIEKDESYRGRMWEEIFTDGRYYIKFDEKIGILSVFLRDTYNKGLSGKGSTINNVRFGGTSIARML